MSTAAAANWRRGDRAGVVNPPSIARNDPGNVYCLPIIPALAPKPFFAALGRGRTPAA